MADLQTVRSLREAGRFADALSTLDGLRIARDEQVAADVLRADLLERTGRLSHSRALVGTLLAGRPLSAADRSACELVLGRVSWASGDADGAIASLQRSIAIASEQHDLDRQSWAELRLLLVLADRSGPSAVAPVLSELRVHVLQAGQPALVAALHIHVAETEAKRGLIRNAQRHLDIGRRGLARLSNLWLEALAENVAAAIETMRSAFDVGTAHAARCLDLSEQAGAASLHQSALGNLGHLAYLSGRFDAATDFLSRARATLNEGSDTWRACTETLARICLAEQRLDECRTLLDDIDRSVSESRERSGYAFRHTQLTRVRWLAAAGRTHDALQHVDEVLALSDRAADHWLRTLALVAKADLLQELSRPDEARGLLETIVPLMPAQPPELFARYEQTLACALARSGHVRLADTHVERARRSYAALGHGAGLLDLSRQWDLAVAAGRTRPVQEAAFDRDRTHSAAMTIGDVASMLLHAGQPALVAREIVGLLDAAACIHAAAAEARSDDGAVEVLARAGTSDEPPGAPERRLAIGRERERDIEVVIRPRADWASTAAINAMVLLLESMRELERGRADREAHATLWPIDELPAEGGGPVTTGHMREMMALARRVAGAHICVLITGESGTGKEVLARAIHAHSPRAQKAFVPFNCAAVPRDLLESQLFGHRRGAFTGADRDQTGVIRSARDGTLFLDEVGELGLDLQPKLLRFLESGEVSPLGDPVPSIVNVRIIAATNANLEGQVREGRFREDLFYRLNVIRLAIKPLRERRDEIPTLVSHFVLQAAQEFHKEQVRLDAETMERLLLYPWPGNVRQLQNEIRRMVALADSNTVLRPDAMSPEVLAATDGAGPAARPVVKAHEMAVALTDKLNPTLSRIEREMIRIALREHHGRVEAAAQALGISRKGLYLKRQRLGL